MTHPWDEFSKSMADESVPRRETLRWLGAAIAGALLSSLGLKSARAAPRDPCKAFCKCRKPAQQKDCLAACKKCESRPHRLCGGCGSYVCCGDGQTCCGDYCTDLDSDFYNCGACGEFCEQPGPNEYGACVSGSCQYECVDGAVRCDDTCTFLDGDPGNCGACGNVCQESAPYCNAGLCSACPPGLTLCGESCVNLAFNDDNCGACGNVCEEPTPFCNGGTCSPCSGGATLCNGVCTNINFDNANCGGCGIVCADYETCSGGTCQYQE